MKKPHLSEVCHSRFPQAGVSICQASSPQRSPRAGAVRTEARTVRAGHRLRDGAPELTAATGVHPRAITAPSASDRVSSNPHAHPLRQATIARPYPTGQETQAQRGSELGLATQLVSGGETNRTGSSQQGNEFRFRVCLGA